MQLKALGIRDLRIIESADLELAGSLTLITGGNGAGKTSVLEAIHLLVTGRTFRKGEPRSLVRVGAERAVVTGRVETGGGEHRVGVGRSGAGLEARLDGRDVRGMVQIARLLPLLVIEPAGEDLLEGAPSGRRALLDWGLFYGEEGYHEIWRRYQRALRQRNEGLKRGSEGTMLTVWDREVAEWGERVDALRRDYAERLGAVVERLAAGVGDLGAIELQYRAGWRQGMSLGEALADGRERDRRAGFTHAGPHRAELEIRVAGTAAAGRISRGQAKLLKVLVRVGQGVALAEGVGRSALVLLDDVGSELDAEHAGWALEVLRASGSQAVVTAIAGGEQSWNSVWRPERVFHVKHGEVTKLV
jgi:DNA replication and repair protein RecF